MSRFQKLRSAIFGSEPITFEDENEDIVDSPWADPRYSSDSDSVIDVQNYSTAVPKIANTILNRGGFTDQIVVDSQEIVLEIEGCDTRGLRHEHWNKLLSLDGSHHRRYKVPGGGVAWAHEVDNGKIMLGRGNLEIAVYTYWDHPKDSSHFVFDYELSADMTKGKRGKKLEKLTEQVLEMALDYIYYFKTGKTVSGKELEIIANDHRAGYLTNYGYPFSAPNQERSSHTFSATIPKNKPLEQHEYEAVEPTMSGALEQLRDELVSQIQDSDVETRSAREVEIPQGKPMPIAGGRETTNTEKKWGGSKFEKLAGRRRTNRKRISSQEPGSQIPQAM